MAGSPRLLLAFVQPFAFTTDWGSLFLSCFFLESSYFYHHLQPSQKSFRTKRTLAKCQRQNRPLPHWIRMRTDNTIKWNAKRRHWRRTKLGL
jgi:large subunit ribosomal protein L39e